ncbi:MAG: DUF3494 domain-containing protein [Bdellovibrionales bacterium]|nr:DUF3494 domain-containing protein [Bdellovibrionales bacterium]
MKNQNFLALALTITLAVGCGGGNGSSNNNPQNPYGDGPMAVNLAYSGLVETNLGSAGAYVILSKAGVTNTGASAIDGHIGVSPAAESYITGFGLTGAGDHATSALVNGNIYAADQAVPTPSNLTTAVGSMETAYTNAAGRSNPDFNELASGDIGGLTLVPGLYKWSSSVTMPMNVTLSGSATDVWIFQIAGDLSMAAGVSILMANGALPENVYWQVAGNVDLFASAHFEGIILGKKAVNLQTLASINGRIYSQTEVTLQDNDVVQP